MTNNRTIRSLLVLLFILCFISGTTGTGCAKDNQDPVKNLVTVNGIAISVNDFLWAYSSEEQRLVSSGEFLGADEMKVLKQKVFDRLINRELLYQESLKQNIVISENRIEEEFQRMRYSMPSDIDLATLEKELGMNEESIKKEFRRVFAIEELMNKVLEKNDTVTEAQMREFYDANRDKFIVPNPPRVSHILITVADTYTDEQKAEARKKIEMVQQKLADGATFPYLARTYSEGPSSVRGGNIGYLKKGRTVKAFEETAYALKTGEVSDIVKTQYGYHLIKVTDKPPDTVFEYEDIKENIETFIKQDRRRKSELAYIAGLKKDAKIELLDDPTTINWQP